MPHLNRVLRLKGGESFSVSAHRVYLSIYVAIKYWCLLYLQTFSSVQLIDSLPYHFKFDVGVS